MVNTQWNCFLVPLHASQDASFLNVHTGLSCFWQRLAAITSLLSLWHGTKCLHCACRLRWILQTQSSTQRGWLGVSSMTLASKMTSSTGLSRSSLAQQTSPWLKVRYDFNCFAVLHQLAAQLTFQLPFDLILVDEGKMYSMPDSAPSLRRPWSWR